MYMQDNAVITQLVRLMRSMDRHAADKHCMLPVDPVDLRNVLAESNPGFFRKGRCFSLHVIFTSTSVQLLLLLFIATSCNSNQNDIQTCFRVPLCAVQVSEACMSHTE